jgi:hypothetical protein
VSTGASTPCDGNGWRIVATLEAGGLETIEDSTLESCIADADEIINAD